jgi:hypothetical protein
MIFFLIIAANGFILCAIQIFGANRLVNRDPTTFVFLIFFIITEILFVILIARQPSSTQSLYFEVGYFIEFIYIIDFFFIDPICALSTDIECINKYLFDS